MKYYYDTGFLEGTQKKLFGQTKPTIDLISIGIVSEDNQEYYAISKDFNLKEAWNRFDLKDGKKVYWIRENVLKPIYYDWIGKDINFHEVEFSFNDFNKLLKKYGKSNKQIAFGIIEFCKPRRKFTVTPPVTLNYSEVKNPIFYAYYGAYDHVALCWLFGRMIDLPKGFPMYSIDLKQMLDEKINSKTGSTHQNGIHFDYSKSDFNTKLQYIKTQKNYPTQQNAHNALHDARWNKNLHEFIQSL